ncbi:MAG: SUMF1/EgtB/PvdO family nonheme iron enzyme [Deltaproteobacteria bacterium]|nr:SUMF1/EgtB/PvdO family nonheme iron enzyme [Deltaproteobacteria bacterium]
MPSRWSVLFLYAGLAGCSAAGARPRDEVRQAAPSSSVDVDEGVPIEGGGRLFRTALEGAEPLDLSYRLVEVDGGELVLAVAEEAHATHVRVADGRGALSDARTLAGRGLAGALATARPWLVTSNGRELALEPLDGAAAPETRIGRADGVVSLATRSVAFLEERVVAPPEPKVAARPPEPRAPPKPATAAKPARSATPKKTAAKPRSHAATRSPSTKPHAPPPPPPLARPVSAKLWATLLDEHGLPSEARDTGITYDRPLPGMGFITARGTSRGAYALVHEAEKSRRERGRSVPFAQVVAAELDASGRSVGRSKPIVGGPRQYGFIEGHLRPRLFTRGERGLYLGRLEVTQGKGTSRRFEAMFLDGASVEVDDAVWIVDPRRALDSEPLAARELAALSAIAAGRPRAFERQSSEEPGRVAWAGARGYFVSPSGLMSVGSATGAGELLGIPFRVARPLGTWAHVDPTGRTLAGTRRGVHELRPRSALTARAPLAAKADTPPLGVAFVAERALALVTNGVDEAHPGGLAVVDLASWDEVAALSRQARVGAVALVGGREEGLFLTLERGELVVTRLDPNGSPRGRTRALAPVQDGFEAVARHDGGALVVGLGFTPPRGAVALVVDAQGRLGEPVPLPLRLDPGRIGLAALPGGGALVWDKPDTRAHDATPRAVVWLDDAGRVAAHAKWPQGRASTAPCPVGAALPGRFPTTRPGEFVALPQLDACAIDTPRWTTAGLRWFGVRTTGLDASAELVTLTLPTATLEAPPTSAARAPWPSASEARSEAARACPSDMVLVADSVCVDRYESQLVDTSGAALSPHYPLEPAVVTQVLDEWTSARLWMGDLHARARPLPPLLRAPDARVVPVATSRPGVLPSGYLSGHLAEASCRAAGKRLCSLDEWTRACRGEEDRDFPYGDEHEQGACNVNRYAHPAATLHGNAAIGHLDPRLHLVEDGGEPMLRPTGSTAGCVSRWGRDGIHDMVGNLDEWVDDSEGAFAGGFYARSTRRGCGAVITVHPRRYFDYSLGTRCCLTP